MELTATLTQLTPCITAKAGTECGSAGCGQTWKRRTTNIPWCAVDGTKLAIAYSVAGGAVDSPDLPVANATTWSAVDRSDLPVTNAAARSTDLPIAEPICGSPIDASYLTITDPRSGGSRARELHGSGCA